MQSAWQVSVQVPLVVQQTPVTGGQSSSGVAGHETPDQWATPPAATQASGA
jgi:hypothetical protein